MIKKIFITIFGVTLILNSFGQNVGQKGDEIKNYTDINGMKQGPWEVKYPNGQIAYVGYFKNNKPVGKFTRYYESGKLFSEAYFYDNSKYSSVKMYNTAERVIGRGRYCDQNKDSIWIFYLDNGMQIAQEEYNNGILHGISKTFYYPSGNLHEIIPYKDGKKHGLYEKYYSDGRIRMRATYCDGLMCDTMKLYYPSGRIESEIPYKNDLRNGVEINYSESGKVTSTIPYDNGRCTDPAIELKKSKELEEIEKLKGTFPDINQFEDPLDFLRRPLR